MIRGINKKWKQPLGFFLTSGPAKAKDLQTVLHFCISKVQQAGFIVKSLICDQGSNNRQLIEKLEGATSEKPYMTINDLYDPLHLLKNVRKKFKEARVSCK